MSRPRPIGLRPSSFAMLALALLVAARDAPAQNTAIPRDSIVARLADLRAIHTPEGVEVLEPIEVNGSTQWLSIRGLNRANPILLVLHGGPGSPVTGMAWAYQKPWEDFFTVVNWDRRGVGKSFSATDSARLAPTLTLQQHVDDAAVAKLLSARKWAREYDGGWYGKPTFDLYFTLPEWGPEYTEDNVANLLPAMAWAERHLIDGAPEPRRRGMVERFEVPVVMLHGRFDLHTPYESALDYFNRIEAPHKRFVTFERSSHMIMFEEPGRMLMTLVNEVLPLTGGGASF